MKVQALILSLLFFGTHSIAQETEYFFEEFSQDYADLENPVSVNNNQIWDDPAFTVPVGFEYKIFDASSNQILFDEDLGGVVYNHELNKAIVVTTADLIDRADATNQANSFSPISYLVEGFEGSRIFKLEWKNAGFFDDDSGDYFVNLQLWIYEGSNMIEIHYGPSNIDDVLYNWQEDFCGLFEFDEAAETAHGYLIEEMTDNYDFSYVTIDDFFEPNTFSTIPENGTVFRFYPEYAVGIEELETAIKTYPNPATDYLYIENKEQKLTEYQIVSLDGRILKTGTSTQQSIQIDLSNLKPAVYLVNCEVQGKHFKKSFVKQ